MTNHNNNQILITGASGFIGQPLSEFLLKKGYPVIGLSRNPTGLEHKGKSTPALKRWNPERLDGWEEILEKASVVVNLAGENIGASRWTEKTKNRILHSRIQSSRTLTKALGKTFNKPHTFVQISGMGFYGSRHEELLDENSSSGHGFLSSVSQKWEAETDELESLGIRRIIVRCGMVLGRNGGGLKRLLLPFRFYLGVTFGNGTQWMPWLHLSD